MTKLLKKLTSMKNLLVLWAVLFITYIVVFDKEAFNNVAMMLTGAVIVYFPVNVKQKELFKDRRTSNDS